MKAGGTEAALALEHFDSLADCYSFIESRYAPGQLIEIESGKNIESGEPMSITVAAYAYRGESRSYPTTTSSMQRLLGEGSLPYAVRKEIERVVMTADAELQKFMRLHPMLSAGFLQHYGAPTELIDITTDLQVAGYFASGGSIGDSGWMCVIPMAEASRRAIVIDLTRHPAAERPRRQSAFALYHQEFSDLKHPLCVSELQLRWFSFTLRDADVERFHVRHDILDAYTDKVAGLLQFIIDNMPKMEDGAAKWLSDRVVPAPFVTKALDWYSPGQPRTVTLIPLCDSSSQYDEARERRRNHETWSLAFTENRAFKFVELLGDVLRRVYADDVVLQRLDESWPAGRNLDHLVLQRRLAFLYAPGMPHDNLDAAAEWSALNGFKFVIIQSPNDIAEARILQLVSASK